MYLEIAHFRNDPLVDELLRILGKAQEELAVGLHCVDVVDRLVNLGVQALDLLLTGGAQQEVIHLRLERVVNLNVDVVAGGLLAFGAAFHGNDVVDDDRIRRVKQRVQPLRYLGKLHLLAAEDLLQVLVAYDVLALVSILQSEIKNLFKKNDLD